MLFQPSFTIIVINVENQEVRARKSLKTTPWGTKALPSVCWSFLWCHCCFSATGENSGWDPASSQSHLTAINFLGSWRQRHLWAWDPLVFVLQRAQGRALQLSGKLSYYISLLAHIQKSQRVKITDIFEKNAWKIIEALTALTKVQP